MANNTKNRVRLLDNLRYQINVEVLSKWPLKWPPTTSKANKLKLSLFVGYIVHVRLFGIPE